MVLPIRLPYSQIGVEDRRKIEQERWWQGQPRHHPSYQCTNCRTIASAELIASRATIKACNAMVASRPLGYGPGGGKFAPVSG